MGQFLESSQTMITILTVINIVAVIVAVSLVNKALNILRKNRQEISSAELTVLPKDEVVISETDSISEDSEETEPEAATIKESTEAVVEEEFNEEIVAAIAAALAAMGYPAAQIASIRPRRNQQWKLDGRMTGVM